LPARALASVHGLNEPITLAVETGDQVKPVDQLLQTAQQRGTKRDGARELILRELGRGPASLVDLKATAASQIGCSGETVWRAANQLKAERLARCANAGPGTPWLWRLTSSNHHANPHR
jgi:hypothetical protein